MSKPDPSDFNKFTGTDGYVVSPSLVEAASLTVEGDVTFGADVVVRGDVTLSGDDDVQDGTVLEG